MLKVDALNYFGNRARSVAEAAGVSESAVSHWGELVPERRAAMLHHFTDGALRYDRSVYVQPAAAAKR